MFYSLSIYYPSKKYGWGRLDRMIERIAPDHLMGRGTAVQTGERDLQFTFEEHEHDKFLRARKRAVEFARGRPGVYLSTNKLD